MSDGWKIVLLLLQLGCNLSMLVYCIFIAVTLNDRSNLNNGGNRLDKRKDGHEPS